MTIQIKQRLNCLEEKKDSVKLTPRPPSLLANLFTGQFKVDNSWYSRNPFPSTQSLSEPSWPTCKCKLVFSIYLSFFFFFLCSPPNQNNSQLIINIHVLWSVDPLHTNTSKTHTFPESSSLNALGGLHPHLDTGQGPTLNSKIKRDGDLGNLITWSWAVLNGWFQVRDDLLECLRCPSVQTQQKFKPMEIHSKS